MSNRQAFRRSSAKLWLLSAAPGLLFLSLNPGCSDRFSGCKASRTCEEEDSGFGGDEGVGTKGDGDDGGDGNTGNQQSAGGEGGLPNGVDQGCTDGAWDHDGNESTPCTEWSICEPGSFVQRRGSASEDQECAPCEEGTYTLQRDEAECNAWTKCAWGTVDSGTSTTDTVCKSQVIDVEVAKGFSCALREDGKVDCWGNNDFGQLGNPLEKAEDSKLSTVPVPVLKQGVDGVPVPLDDIVGISCGYQTSCGVSSDGGVFCWGNNSNGQLGQSVGQVGPYSSLALQVPQLEPAVQVAVGRLHACAVMEDGSVRCWAAAEASSEPLLGVAPVTTEPARVELPAPCPYIATGPTHSCAFGSGDSFCWGRDRHSLFGTNIQPNPSPFPWGGIPSMISAGESTLCALLQGGTVECVGEGPFGKNTYFYGEDPNPSPLEVPQIAEHGPIVDLAVDLNTRCLLFEDGSVACWGHNDDQQLGNRSTENSAAILLVEDVAGAIAMDAAYGHVCVLQSDDRVLCWGENEHGEAGDPSLADVGLPRLVAWDPPVP